MAIKQYKPVHQKALIKILRLNTPQYFDTSEEQDFIDYLENELEILQSYVILEQVVDRLNLTTQMFEVGRIQTSQINELPFYFKSNLH